MLTFLLINNGEAVSTEYVISQIQNATDSFHRDIETRKIEYANRVCPPGYAHVYPEKCFKKLPSNQMAIPMNFKQAQTLCEMDDAKLLEITSRTDTKLLLQHTDTNSQYDLKIITCNGQHKACGVKLHMLYSM